MPQILEPPFWEENEENGNVLGAIRHGVRYVFSHRKYSELRIYFSVVMSIVRGKTLKC